MCMISEWMSLIIVGLKYKIIQTINMNVFQKIARNIIR